MNFYKHHLGDYDGDTSHLSWDEDMAYTRLLRAYYRRERPIGDGEAYRLARASSKAQRAAVDSVLAEFFEKCADGWHNKRADEEVAAYQAQADTNRRIAKGRRRGRNENEPSDEPLNEPSTKGTPNQEPRTKNQEPEKEKRPPARKRATHIPESFKVSDRVKAWAQEQNLTRLDEHLEAFRRKCAAKGYTYIDWDSAFMEAIRTDWAKLRGDGNGTAPDYSELVSRA